MLMTLEGDQLQVRAARGEGFKISSTVRDQVLSHKDSLLVRDAQLDQGLKEHMSIVEQKVRSMIAVPLQTNDKVIGLIYVDSPHQLREFTREDLNLLTVMANVAAIRIEHARLNEIEEQPERAMAKEMQQAALIQQRLLRATVAPSVEGMDIAGRAVAARHVGGDYYDFIRFDEAAVWPLMVADVAGKGMPAAVLMSGPCKRGCTCCSKIWRSLWRDKMARLNRQTCGNCPDNRFHYVFPVRGGIPRSNKLVYANAGHNPPVVVRAKGGYDLLGGGGVILGIMPKAVYEQSETTFEPGDILVLFSDGVTEAPDPQDQEFGEERLAELVVQVARPSGAGDCRADSPARCTPTRPKVAPPADDITVLIARRL